MPLSLTDPIVKRADGKSLKLAQVEDQRHRLHAETASNADSASPYFKTWVNDYITPTIESVSTRNQLLRDMVFPLASNELVDEINDSASAVHQAQDRFIAIEMIDEKLQADAEEFIERADVNGFISRDCHNALFDSPNSLVVIDLPSQQTTDFPEPYFHLLASDKVEKVLPLKKGLLNFVLFNTQTPIGMPLRKALFDAEDFIVYEKQVSGDWKEIVREPHNLGYTPVFKLWADVKPFNLFASNTLISPSLGLLDQYVYWSAAHTSNDQKAAFSPFWHLQEAPKTCGYVNEYQYACEEGVILYPGSTIDAQNNVIYSQDVAPVKRPCPRCAKKKAPGGLGGRIPVPIPLTKDAPDFRPPAGWIGVPIESLKYIRDKVERMAANVRRSATGREGGPQNDQALNESQIAAILEASKIIGQYLAEYFEVLHKRILDTLLRLRYGSAYVGCTVNYGRRFSTLSGDLLTQLLLAAKKIGSLWLIEEIDGMLRDYYARGDASRALRYELINDLTKYPFYSAGELFAVDISEIDPEGFALHVGLMGYIKRFEREFKTPIERFGLKLPYSNRVQTIIDTITEYVSDLRPKQSVEDDGSGSNQDESSAGPKSKQRANVPKPGGKKGTGANEK